jgi:hypothetical protein
VIIRGVDALIALPFLGDISIWSQGRELVVGVREERSLE